MTRRRRSVALALAGSLLVTGCSDGLDGTGDANFVTGEGAIVQVAPEDREDPVEISGESLQGEPVDLAEHRGDVVVLNFWGSWCNPCREEAPVLAEADEQLDAVFIGAQLRYDNLDDALSFEEEFGIDYPTINDGGESLLALGSYTPRSAPATAVLDAEGRVAALVSGVVPSVGTLEDLIEDAAAGSTAGFTAGSTAGSDAGSSGG